MLCALALLVCAASVHAQTPPAVPAFAIEPNTFVRGIYLDGDLLSVAGSHQSLQWRNGTHGDPGRLYTVSAHCGARVGSGVLIVSTDSRDVTFSNGQTHTRVALPVIDHERITSCAVDAAGRTYFTGERHAIYVHHRGTWRTVPMGTTPVSVIVARDDGAVFAVGFAGVVRVETDRMVPVPVQGFAVLGRSPESAWLSPVSGRLYLAAGASLLAVDLAQGRATAHPHGMFGSANALAGVATANGDQLAIAAQSDVALFDGRTFTVVARGAFFARGLAFDVRGRALYIGAQSAVTRVALPESWAMAPSVPLSAPEVAARVTPPVPSTIPTARVPTPPSQSPSQDDITSLWFPTVRAAFGVSIGNTATGALDSGFAFDARAGALRYTERRSRLQLWPELGVAYNAGPAPGGTYFTAGLSALYGGLVFSGGVGANLVFGDARTGVGVGLRSSLVMQFAATSLTVDLSHQYLNVGPENRHEFRATIGLNPLPLILAVALFRGSWLFR